MNISTRWFVKEFSTNSKKIKNLKVFIIGINSTREFKNKKQLFVKDWVLDITKFFSLSDVAAVPLKYGQELIQNFRSRDLQFTCGINNFRAEGLNYKNKSIMIADDPKKFADKVIYLYQTQS